MRERAMTWAILMMAACYGVEGSGKATTDDRETGEFSNISLSGNLELEFVTADKTSVSLHGDDNLVALVKTEVKDGQLRIWSDENLKESVLAVVTAPALIALDCSGATKANIAGVSTDSFELDVSGASKITLAGTVKAFDADLSGAIQLDAEQLKTEKTKLSIRGAMKANVFVTRELTARVSGAGKVTYAGNPARMTSDVGGSGSVSAK